MVTPPNIELHIEELVLHGFLPGDRQRIGLAVQQELSRLFTEQGLPPGLSSGGAVPSLDAGSFQHAPHATPNVVGQQIANTVFTGLKV
ncbi:hypothetical protein [uncultured Chitinophaga sp.]|jgi:hypothetical protein|uniref:hypothetical protein n=1 Tax=uncultured Chitinophaga sp. TaxID=339340 RepID=UPI00261935F2|nr:hypothetical protein [uncultured Chitinophaga sp.]